MAVRDPLFPNGASGGRSRTEDEERRRAEYFSRPHRHWREEVTFASGFNACLGVWLMLSPVVLGFAGEDPIWSALLLGSAIGTIALLRIMGGERASGLSWINAAFGVWTFTTAFWLYDTSSAAWNAALVGAAVFVMALWSATASESRPGPPRQR